MRRYVATAALSSLVCLLLFAAPLLAKPTRAIPRPGPKAATLSLRPTRERAGAKPAARSTRPSRANTRSHATQSAAFSPTRHTAAPARALAAASPRTRASRRQRGVAAQAAIAARSAILAADAHHSRPSRRSAAQQDIASLETPSPRINSIRSTALTNVGGVLQPALPGTLPLRSIEEEAATPVFLPPLRVSQLYDTHGRLMVPAPLRGSREILLHQNEMADRDGLDRVRDDTDLLDLRREKKLVAIPESDALTVDYRLPIDRRYSRPWTAAFLGVLAHDYYASFHSPLQVDSAVRTIAVQQRLVRTNGNAAPTTGDTASPHLTGQAVDIAKGGLSRIQIAWMRAYLQPLIDQGKIDVEEEFQQACFHISVYKAFLPAVASHVAVTAERQSDSQPIAGGPSY